MALQQSSSQTPLLADRDSTYEPNPHHA